MPGKIMEKDCDQQQNPFLSHTCEKVSKGKAAMINLI